MRIVAYLLGRYYWDQFTEESILKAIDQYERSIQLDPAYAAAYAGIAECWGGSFLPTPDRGMRPFQRLERRRPRQSIVSARRHAVKTSILKEFP